METLLLKKRPWNDLLLFAALLIVGAAFAQEKVPSKHSIKKNNSATVFSGKPGDPQPEPALLFSASITSTPAVVCSGASAEYSMVITNLSEVSGNNGRLGSFKIAVPSGFTIPSSISVSLSSRFSATFSSGYINVARTGPAQSSSLSGVSQNSPGGESLTVTFRTTAPLTLSNPNSYIFSTQAWVAENFEGTQYPDLATQPQISLNVPLEASFANPPSDIAVACGATIPEASSLSYSNADGCLISGSVTSTQSAQVPPGICGGVITETWTFTDAFSRTITHSRTITVSPPAVASFADVSDITVDCGAATTSNLGYTNGKTGNCEISGSVTSTLSVQDPSGYCGGDIIESWTYTDSCNRTITKSRTIHVRPKAEASFADVNDITVDCGAATTSSLGYSNGKTGNCEISGSVTSTLSIQDPSGYCGGDITESWTYTDSCNRTITKSRTIHVRPKVEASFADVNDITVDCGAATTSSLGYSNGKTGNCEISGSITSTLSVQDPSGYCGGDITESWTYTDSCNRTITKSRTIHVRPTAVASFVDVSDITVDCGAATTSSLDYSNGQTDDCEIRGSVISTLSVDNPAGYCGGDITESWTYTDNCNRTITTSRIIHVRPAVVVLESEDAPCYAGNSGVPKVYLCHQTGSTINPCVNICVDQSAVAEHLAHGDVLGECPSNCTDPNAAPTAPLDEENVALFKVKAYPNPSNKQFTFEIESESSDDINITVLDISGRLLKEITNVKAPSVTFGESLPRGVYFAMVEQGNNQKMIRIVKE